MWDVLHGNNSATKKSIPNVCESCWTLCKAENTIDYPFWYLLNHLRCKETVHWCVDFIISWLNTGQKSEKK